MNRVDSCAALPDSLMMQYFYRECFAWSQLKHKYILSLVGIYRDPQPMMVSPLAVHRTLEHFVEDRALYNPKEDQERFVCIVLSDSGKAAN
jgi:hypothetical protein